MPATTPLRNNEIRQRRVLAEEETRQKIIEQQNTAEALRLKEEETRQKTAALKETVKARDEATTNLKDKEEETRRAESLLYVNQISEAHDHWKNHDLLRCRLALDESRWDLRGPEYAVYLPGPWSEKPAPCSAIRKGSRVSF